MMQGVLFFSMKEKGKHSYFQAQICKVITGLIVAHALLKAYYVFDLGSSLKDNDFKNDKTLIEMLGMNYVPQDCQTFIKDDKTVTECTYVLNIIDSFTFEVVGCFITFLLLKYYLSQSDNRKRGDKYHYMHNTLYLKQFVKIQQLFFFFLVTDSFFSPTFIQLIVLCKRPPAPLIVCL